MGISRSEFFVHAARRYLEDLDAPSDVEQINAAADTLDDSNSVANVTALVTLDESDLTDEVSTLAGNLLADVERGLRRLLSLA